MAVFISLAAGAININSMNRGSAVAVGENAQPGWTQNGKTNFGNGQQFGCNLQTLYIANLVDNDLIDSPITENQPAASLQNQTL